MKVGSYKRLRQYIVRELSIQVALGLHFSPRRTAFSKTILAISWKLKSASLQRLSVRKIPGELSRLLAYSVDKVGDALIFRLDIIFLHDINAFIIHSSIDRTLFKACQYSCESFVRFQLSDTLSSSCNNR